MLTAILREMWSWSRSGSGSGSGSWSGSGSGSWTPYKTPDSMDIEVRQLEHSGLILQAFIGDELAAIVLKDWIEENSYMPPYAVGSVWIFFMATRYIIGKVKEVTPFEVILEQASWVPDTGRMYDALASGNFTEVEPFPSGISVINRFAINDATLCDFKPPTKQK